MRLLILVSLLSLPMSSWAMGRTSYNHYCTLNVTMFNTSYHAWGRTDEEGVWRAWRDCSKSDSGKSASGYCDRAYFYDKTYSCETVPSRIDDIQAP